MKENQIFEKTNIEFLFDSYDDMVLHFSILGVNYQAK